MAAAFRPEKDRNAVPSILPLRLMAAICALLVLFVGAWAASHAELSLGAPATASYEVLEAHSEADIVEPTPAAAEAAIEGVLLGAVICLLLVLLGFMPAALVRHFFSRSTLLDVGRTRRSPPGRHPLGRSSVPALTISQLSLSRI